VSTRNCRISNTELQVLGGLAVQQTKSTTKKFNTRIGHLFFDHDYPMNPTVQHLDDTMDYQRACQLYLWGQPIVDVAL
jgi:hypothetical protein